MEKGTVSIKDLLKEDGSYLSFQEFKGKLSCNKDFLLDFQIISAITDRLRSKGRQIESINKHFFFFILTEISHSTLIKPNPETFTIFLLIKPTLGVRPVLKDGANYFT